ncbi:hypothetical protein C8T65DRAFT_727693 [Cerioporus squamosus]|nr:hypothetical protein C8T65DRAFT_727693 [Cerioporus squamosus]
MNQVMPEQGRQGLIGTPQQPIDTLRALAPDSDSKTHVYLLVFASDDDDARYGHWSLAWQVGGGRGQLKAWRHIHVQVHRVLVSAGPGRAPVEEPRYVHWGGLTKAEGALTASARKISLGKMTLAMRVRIEELAMGVPVMRMGPAQCGREPWNCQDWVRELAARMVAERLMDRRTWESAVVDAYKRELVAAALGV